MRTCPNCQSENPPEHRYCADCGQPLHAVCAVCDFRNPPRANFCAGCGRPLGEPGRPAAPTEGIRAQRRQITVLFADLVGSTSLAIRLDPEDLRLLIHRYQHLCSEVVEQYGGHVAQYLGDGILVYFGYPRAHEDDPARAARAGLEIVQRLAGASTGIADLHLEARVGLATGTVVVDEHHRSGAVSRQEVVGETPNLAARLQELADPGTVVIADTTRRLLGGQFKYVDLGSRRLKGFSAPVHAWRVVAPADTRIRFDATRGRRLPPLVGRDKELQWLRRRWDEALQGRGQVVLVSGPAGIGKSRLCKALSTAIGDTRVCTPIRLQCSPYHTTSPLYPFIAHLERAAGIRPNDAAQCKLERLEALLTRATETPGEALPLIASLLSVPGADDRTIRELTPVQRRERTLAALVDQLEALAHHRPVFVQVEDAHWIDPTSRELLQACMDRCRDLPVLMLVTYRPENPFPAPDLPHVHPLPLRRLRMEESRILARHVAAHELEAPILDQIVLRTDGIPLYVEEVTKSVVNTSLESGGAAKPAPSVPASLRDALTERLDRLGPARRVAQICAVIGREVPFDLLDRLADLPEQELERALQRLLESGILFRSRRTQRGWSDFFFKHALVRDTAYESLLLTQRRHLHLRVAETIEEHFAERARRNPELLATHYGEGGEPAKAAHHWGRAALEALSRSANSEVILHVEKALDQLQRLPAGPRRLEQELRFHILLGGARRAASGFASEDMRQAFEAARTICQQLGESATPVLIDVLRGLYSYHYARGELNQARELAEQVVTLAKRCDPASLTVGLYMLGGMQFWQGEFQAAEQTLTRAWKVYDRHALREDSLSAQTDPGAFALFQLAWTQWMLGRPAQAMKTAEQVLSFSRELRQPFTHSMTLFWVGTTALCCGRRGEAARLAAEMLELTTNHRLRYLRACALVLRGHVEIDSGRIGQGIASVDEAMADFAAQGAGLGTAWALSKPIEAHIHTGRLDQARELITAARAAIARNGEMHWAPEIERLAGELAQQTAPAEPDRARAGFRRARDLAGRLGATALELRAAISLAASADAGSTAERTALSEVLGRVENGLPTPDTEAAQLLLSEGQIPADWGREAGQVH